MDGGKEGRREGECDSIRCEQAGRQAGITPPIELPSPLALSVLPSPPSAKLFASVRCSRPRPTLGWDWITGRPPKLNWLLVISC